MYGKLLAVGLVALTASLFPSKPAHAEPSLVCQAAQLSGAPLGLCNAYVTGRNCLDPSIHDSQRCVSLRRSFAGITNGKDLDQILGSDSVRAVVPSTGGSVTLPGVGTVTFSSDAFANDTTVEVAAGRDAAVAALFDEFASIFRPSSRLAYEVTVTTGALPPLSETFDVRLDLPADFLAQVPDDYGIELFAILEQDSDQSLPYQSFELFESHLTETGTGIVARLPGAVFFLDGNGAYKAVFTLAPTPGAKDPPAMLIQSGLSQLQSSSLSASECKAASIACPVSGGCTVTSPFSAARSHPVLGTTRPHHGTDYRASTGTPILSAAGGTIERSYTSGTFGETIIVRHTDGGATLYAHLQRRDVQADDTVSRGQNLGTANSTGVSEASHLHMEYVPNGQIIQSKSRIDPDACVDAEGSGSVTVSDSGNLADDAFGVAIDGFVIGQTSTGASNTLAISNLKVGEHTLTLTVLIAPDNVGTYTVTLNDGLKFADGSSAKSGTAPRGATLNWQFIVP